jgi:lipoate-protein ligase A
MGISGKPELLLNIDTVKNEKIPVIQRFSGGGTVIVDENTLFITFIIAKNHLPIEPFPEPILQWTGNLYTDAWQIPNFHLQENDYCIGEKKCGGNAQYIKKDRWLHHTSFLWDFKSENMEHLQLPSKRPKYRGDRPHSDFLTRLKGLKKSPQDLLDLLEVSMSKQFSIREFDFQSWQKRPHRQSARLIDL